MATPPKNWNQNIKPSSLGFGYVVGNTDGDGDFDGAMDKDIASNPRIPGWNAK